MSNYKMHNKAFSIGIILNTIFVGVEVFYGLLANSSALLADAGHNASDVLGLLFAWIAAYLSTLKARGNFTFGFKKSTILVSILNSLLLFAALIAIGWDAVDKLFNPREVAGTQMMIVAGIGTFINTFTAFLFFKDKNTDLNIKSAYLHMAADAAISLGVVVAGLLITISGKMWIDPLMSFIVIGIIMYSTVKLFFDSTRLALGAVPEGVDIEEVREFILNKPQVDKIEVLQIWAISTTETNLNAHLRLSNNQAEDFVKNLNKELLEKFNIHYSTIQIG
jgi:cobalt-zinc-cadmium efflux system protein